MKVEYGALIRLKESDIAELFHNGMSVLMLIDRTYGNSHKGSRRWINKLISYDKESFEVNLDKLIKQQNYLNQPNIRLYGSLNYRSLDKGIKRFFHTLIDVTPADRSRFWANINANFVSSIMKPESRVSSPKRWLLDIDSDYEDHVEAFMRIMDAKGVKFLYKYGTVKGYHAIIEPYNKMEIDLPDYVELKQDGLILLRAVGDEVS
jgi:hypothetical protein